jgi:hypothetical protein
MGASDLTTDVPEAEVDDGRSSPANGTNGHVAKKRKKQKALADVPAATNGAVVTDDRTLELPAVEDVDEVGEDEDAVAVDDVDEDAVDDIEEAGLAEDLDGEDADAAPETKAPADARRRARRRERKRAKRADGEPKLRRRAAKRAAAARRSTPAGRRAELVATAASIAAASAEARPGSSSGRVGRFVRRLVALIAIVMVPGAVYALVVTDGPARALPQADAAYLSQQLITADQRVRRQLVRLRPLHTSAAIARTRESQLTARSIALEIGDHGGAVADRLQRAAKLEARWLDAVGSVLSNPRSPLRDELVARDAALRPALAALPSTDGLRRKGGAARLRAFAKHRLAAKRHHRR